MMSMPLGTLRVRYGRIQREPSAKSGPSTNGRKGENITHSANVIQTQTTINPGNSGGPLLNDKAQVIGINSFQSSEGEGLNYAIAGDTIEIFLKRPTNRDAEAPAKPKSGISRVERFGDDIAGAYMESQTPPPDAWLMLRGNQDMPEYAVIGASTKNKLDTVFKGVDPKWKQLSITMM